MRNKKTYTNQSSILLLLLPFLINSFSQHLPKRTFHSKLFSSTLTSSSTSSSDQCENRNIFQSKIYQKPIVLLGTSSNNELYRLANYFTTTQFKQEREISNDENIISPTSSSSSYKTPQELILDINNNKLKFPQVIVLDNKDNESLLLDYAKELYETSKLLSIFINVESADKELEELFVQYTDYELCIKDEGSSSVTEDWEHVEWELSRIVARAMLAPPIPGDVKNTYNTAYLTMGKHTFFLSLSFPKIEDVEQYIKEMCVDVDTMEYRTDLLDARDSRFEMIYGQQLLRKYARPHAVRVPGLPFGDIVIDDSVPIVYTVRTKNQAGTFPDESDDDIAKMFEMLEWGLRSGVDVLDVESAWDYDKYVDKLLSKAEERYTSQILGSHHVVGKQIPMEDAVYLYQQCALFGRAHGAKVVLSIEDDKKDSMAYEASLIASSLAASDDQPVIPNISLILGDIGSFSRVINLPFTPVTHELLPFKAAPGQLTANEIMTTRLITKILQPKQYAILGHNIDYSVSPQMHNAAFEAVRLPHKYGRIDVPKVEDFTSKDFFTSEYFGGCSVTIPHKQAIIPYCDVLSDAAKEIGSVNTLIVKEEMNVDTDTMERKIYGDNTDWKGIYNPILRRLRPSDEKGYALIIGAGGTARAAAYAAQKLSLDCVYYNRTPEKAQELVDAFDGVVITSLEKEVLEPYENSIKVVISTLPAAAEFILPLHVYETEQKPIIFDVNYKPYQTLLLSQAEEKGCLVVRGSEMLWEQGVGQFELWTERTAPYKVMKNVVLQNCLPQEDEDEKEEVQDE